MSSLSMRLKNSLHISKVDDNIPIMIVTGLQYISLQLCGTCCFCIFCANFQFLAETKAVFPPFVGLSAKILYNRLLPRTWVFQFTLSQQTRNFVRQKRHHNWDWFSTICNDNGITLPEYWVMQQKSKLSFLQSVSGTIWELFDRQPLVNFLVWVHYSPRSISRMHYIYYIISLFFSVLILLKNKHRSIWLSLPAKH